MFGPLGAEKYAEYIIISDRAAEHPAHVINDILDMSKIEAGRLRLDLRDRRARRHSAPTRCASFGPCGGQERRAQSGDRARRRLHGRPARRQTDPAQFVDQRGEVHARGRPRDIARARVARLRVHRHSRHRHRHSAGIADQLGRPFEQVESQLTKSYHGSGLGLAIAKSLIELHGGTMRIRSTVGIGTLVMVRLRAIAASAARSRSRLRLEFCGGWCLPACVRHAGSCCLICLTCDDHHSSFPRPTT